MRMYQGRSENSGEGRRILGREREYWGRSENIGEGARILGGSKSAVIVGTSRQSPNNKGLECCLYCLRTIMENSLSRVRIFELLLL